MEKVLIMRGETSDQGTFGVLEWRSHQFYSLELPWRDNKPNVSCVPPGKYLASWSYSPRFKRLMYGVAPIPNRSGVRMHAANLAGDKSKGFKAQLNGCIALGKKLGWIDGQKSLLLSKPAMREFEDLMRGQIFELEIR